MEHLLFAGYLILFAWIVTRTGFFNRSGLSSSQLVIFFLLKVMAGILYGWIGVYYGNMAQMVDTWAYHYQSMQETRLLLNDPKGFFGALLDNSYDAGFGNFFSSTDSWWNDLKANSFIKLLAIFNIFSFSSYYINVIFYSFLSMFGTVAILRVMFDAYPGRRIAVMLAVFLVPSFLYWTSGLHKEGMLFLGFSLVIYPVYFGLKENRFTFLRFLGIIAGIMIVLFLRNFLISVLLPGILAWILASRLKARPLLVFSISYLVYFIVFFTAKYIHPALDFPAAVADKQEAFIQLHGASSIHVNRLEPHFASFAANTPQALVISSIRPFPTDVRHLLSLAASVEINLLLLLVLLFLLLYRGRHRARPLVLFCIFFSFSVLLMIGYSVNNLGAIVRYRSIILPFIMVPVIANIPWNRVYQLLFGNMEKN